MPNWVKNRLVIGGEDADKVKEALLVKDPNSDSADFDFNKILPMPLGLRITSGSVTDKCLALYLTSVNPAVEYYGVRSEKLTYAKFGDLIEKFKKSGVTVGGNDFSLPAETIFEYEKSVVGCFAEGIENSVLATKEAAIAYGKTAAENVLQYGFMDWYNWSVANWGTKWNACGTELYGDQILFDTAWSDVADLMKKLAKMYPRNTFVYDFAEEGAGVYAGEFSFKNGKESSGKRFKAQSKSAYEKYFELWGGEEEFRFNEQTGTYEFIEETASEKNSEAVAGG